MLIKQEGRYDPECQRLLGGTTLILLSLNSWPVMASSSVNSLLERTNTSRIQHLVV